MEDGPHQENWVDDAKEIVEKIVSHFQLRIVIIFVYSMNALEKYVFCIWFFGGAGSSLKKERKAAENVYFYVSIKRWHVAINVTA